MSAAWLLCAAATAAGDPKEEPTLRWNGRPATLAELPAELGPGPRVAVGEWAPWAAELGYKLHLSNDGRVLLVLPKTAGGSKELKLADKVARYFDEVLPCPPRPEQPERPAAPEPASGGPLSWNEAFGGGAAPLETETAVLIQARDASEYGSALRDAAKRHPYLESWIAAGTEHAGFHLEQPLAAIWLEAAKDLVEYSVENELVHRLTQLLILRRFGQEPYWLATGIAWHVEMTLLGEIYCYPYRGEFVYASEHSSWEADLKERYKGAGALRMEDIAALQRGSFEGGPALNAWGAATLLAKHHADALPAILEDLRLVRDEKGITRRPDGTWELVPGWTATPADQLAIFEKRIGPGFLAEVLAFYKTGRKPRSG